MKQPEQQVVSATMVTTQPSSETNNVFLCNKQLENDITGPILMAREADCKPDAESLRRHFRKSVNSLNFWMFEYFKGKQDRLQLVVPNNMRDMMLEESHAGRLGGHLGKDRTLGRVREKFFWTCYAEQVRQWCRTCIRCVTRKKPTYTHM